MTKVEKDGKSWIVVDANGMFLADYNTKAEAERGSFLMNKAAA